jgi:hypothetical protein
VFGRLGPDIATSLGSGWRLLFEEGLEPHAERVAREENP